MTLQKVKLQWLRKSGNCGRTQSMVDVHSRSFDLWTPHTAASSSWFARSACPLVCGWKPEDRLTFAPRAEQNSLQTREVNWGHGQTQCPLEFHGGGIHAW